MDPELLAEQLVARYGVDGARARLAGSTHPEDMAVLAVLGRADGGGSRQRGGFLGNLGPVTQVGAGLGEVLPTLGRGLANLGGAVIPGNDPLQRAGQALGGLLEQRREESAPQGGVETGARLLGRLGGEVGLGFATGGLSRLAGAGTGMRLGAEALAGGGIAAASPEDSALSLVSDDLAQNPVARFLGDTALVGAGDLIARGVKSLRGRGVVDEVLDETSRRVNLRIAADEIESQIPNATGREKRLLEEGLEEARQELADTLPVVHVRTPEVNVPYSGPTRTELLSMSPREIGVRVQAELDADKNLLETLFGADGAARYNRLQRTANSASASREASSAAYDEIVKMEDALTESQRNRLFGVGGEGILDPDELMDIQRAAHEYDPEFLSEMVGPNEFMRTDDDLLNVIGRELLTGNPQENVVSAIRLRESVAELGRRGMGESEIVERAVAGRATREGLDAADAEFLFRSTMNALRGEAATGAEEIAQKAIGRGGRRNLPPAATVPDTITVQDELLDKAGNLVRGAKVYYGDRMVGNIGRIVGARANNPELFDEAVETVRRIVAQHGDEILKNPKDWDASAELARQFLVDGKYGEAIKKLPGDMNVVETMAVSMMAKNNLKMSQKLSRQLHDPTLSPQVRQQVAEELHRVGREGDEAFWSRFLQGSESAKRLAVFRWETANLDDPLAIMTAAQRAFVRDRGYVPIPPELRQHLLDLAEKAAGGDKAARKLLNTRIAQLDAATPWEKFETLWKAGLLTSFTTPLANMAGNVTLAALERAKAAPAAFMDRLLSGIFGTDRTRTFSLTNFDEATQFGKRFADEIQGIGQKLDFKKQTVFKNLPEEYGGTETVFDKLKVNAIMDAYTKTVFASLEQGDRIFLQRAIARSATDYAKTLVANSSLKGNDAVRQVIKLIESPSDEMAIHGITEAHLKAAQAGVREDALLATLRNEGKAAKIGMAGKRFADALTLGRGGEFLVPFSRTPANIAGRIIESSPVGLLDGGVRLSWATLKKVVGKDPGMTPELQRLIVDRMGRGATGTSLVAFGGYLAHRGLLTGALPEGQGERDMFFQSGKQPNSIKIGDTWVGLERLSPLGNLLVLGASIYNQATGGENWSGAAAGSLASIGSTLSEQPFLTGIRRTLESVSDPNAAGNQVETFAGSFVPNIVRSVARGVDPTIREQRGIGDALKASIPGQSQDLPARIQPLGDAATRDKGVLGQLFIPAQLSRDERRDRVVAALDSLGVSLTRRSFERSGQPGESPQQFERRAREEGQELRAKIEQLVERPSFQRKDREEQRKAIERLVESLRGKQTTRAKRVYR